MSKRYHGSPKRRSRFRAPGLVVFLCLGPGFVPAFGAELYAGDGLTLRWDNTLRYTAAVRVSPRESALIANINGDDGDRNFAPGLVSNRLDLLSELDVSHDNVGIHASLSAWYDTVYFTHTANTSAATYNAASVPSTQFPRSARNLLGAHAEIADAFAFGNFDVDGTAVSARIGRQTVLWGESVFFDPNSIAAAQAPYDYTKGTSTLADYSKSIYLPVNQVSVSVQPNPIFSLSFYYQFEWRPSRQPPVGSYFSYLDAYGAGAERLFLPDGHYLAHVADETSPSSGQYGIALHTHVDDFDFGIYALRYNAKSPYLETSPGAAAPPGAAGTFHLDYPAGIELYGLSLSSYIGDDSIAGEISVRHRMPLISAPQYVSVSTYARGDVLHGQVSSEIVVSPNQFWDGATLALEAAGDYLLDVTENKNALNPTRDPFNLRVRALFEPRLFEVAPNLALSLPISIGYNLMGRSDTSYTLNADSGDLEAGISASYLTVWHASLTFTGYFGPPDRQPLADRDFLSVSVERTF